MKHNHALHVYFGEGKGKTTCSMGLAVRAAGSGRKVFVSQFMKTNTSSELKSLACIPNIQVVLGRPIEKLTSRMTAEELANEKLRQAENFQKVCDAIDEMQPSVILLDEALVAEHIGFLDVDLLLRCVDKWLDTAEVILTGRWVSPRILEAADYATEMTKRKHPFDNGVMARKGIEF